MVKGIRRLQKASDGGRIKPVGAIAVLNPDFEAAVVFDHLVQDLGIRNFDVLLPEAPPRHEAVRYGEFLCRLFDHWVSHGDPDINVRIFRNLINKFRGISSYGFPHGSDPVTSSAFKISSSGTLYPDDVLYDERWHTPHVTDTNLRAWLDSSIFHDMDNLGQNLPEKCRSCCWSKICGGGHPWNRYSKERGFDNPSSLCEGLKLIYAHVASYLLSIGVARSSMFDMLGLSPEESQEVEAL